MKFCFHSVRSRTSIPPAHLWPCPEDRDGFWKWLSVNPDWFEDFLPKAKAYYGEDLEITFDDGYRDIIVPAIYSVKKYGIRTTVFIPTAYIGQMFPLVPYEVMSFQEIRYLADQGVEIGSHGHSHLHWAELPVSTVIADIETSLSILKPLARRVTKVAAPYGSFTGPQAEAIYRSLQLSVYATNEDIVLDGKVFSRVNASMSGMEIGYSTGSWPWVKK